MVEQPNKNTESYQKNSEDPNQDNDVEMEEVENENEDDSYLESEEYQSINNELNMLNSVLDEIEQKNDNIWAELNTLLKENQEIRKQLQQCQYDDNTGVQKG